jgi:hypothetical protein
MGGKKVANARLTSVVVGMETYGDVLSMRNIATEEFNLEGEMHEAGYNHMWLWSTDLISIMIWSCDFDCGR